MDINTFLQETPLWILVPIGLSYVAVLGYFLWLFACLLRS
jgi:hypothetical protein